MSKLSTLSSAEFLGEIRHLCWTEPLTNSATWDEGWHCRDQALLLATVIAATGYRTSVLDGAATFVRGRDAEAGPIALEVSPHSWVGVEREGFFDMSPRLKSVGDQRIVLDERFESIFGSRCLPEGKFKASSSRIEFDGLVERAKSEKGLTVVYLGEDGTYADICQSLLRNAFDYVNSPLTDQLRLRYKPEIYAQAAVHLLKFVRQGSASLRPYPREIAWDKISTQPGDAIGYLARRGGFR